MEDIVGRGKGSFNSQRSMEDYGIAMTRTIGGLWRTKGTNGKARLADGGKGGGGKGSMDDKL